MIQLNEKQLLGFLQESIEYSALHWQTLQGSTFDGLQWYRHIAGLGHFHIPFFIVLDLGLLLVHGFEAPFASEQNYQHWPEAQRPLRLRYENEVLGRLLQESIVQEIIEVLQLQGKNDGLRLRLLELLINSLAPHYPRNLLLHPAHLRRIHLPPQKQLAKDIEEKKLEQSEGFSKKIQENLTQFLDNIAHKVNWSKLLRQEDRFELRHWEVLDTEEIRIGCRQILEIERRLGEVDTRNVYIADENAQSETAFVDETYYPTGGLTELTNRGSFENLVLSELIYIEDENPDKIDLFDIRFVEKELLFYKRDSGQLRRKRRTVHLIIDLDHLFQLKISGYDYQFSILTQGLFLRIIRDLLLVFPNDAMEFHFHYLTREHNPEPIQRELKIMRLLLADEEQHGWIHFHFTKQIDLSQLEEDKRKVYALTMTTNQHFHRWQQLFESYRSQTPAILGIPIHVTTQVENIQKEQKSSFVLPLQGASIEKVALLKNQLISEIASLQMG